MLDYERFQTRSRVSLADYERNLRAMLEIARERGIGVVALYNELSPNSPYRRVLREVAQADGVPFVDASALLAEARRAIEDDLERRLGLRPPPGAPRPPEAPVAVVLRVYAGERAVPGGLFVAGADEQLGALVPNRVAMHDDGTHGDQRAGDRVWSYRATFPVGARVYYVYTNGGAPGAWRGLDVPEVRGFRVEAERWLERHRPIEVFGRVHMQADSWHTNAAGHRMIAEALLHELEREPRVRRHLAER
jgi:lysophospholipase L1-like esterase